MSATVLGLVHSASAGWSDPVTRTLALVLGALLIALFVGGQHRAAQSLMPLRLFADRARAGAYLTHSLRCLPPRAQARTGHASSWLSVCRRP